MANQFECIKLGWLVNDVVHLNKEWCYICARVRLHEHYNGWMTCIVCAEQTAIKPAEVAH